MDLRLYEWTYGDYCNLVDFLKEEADTKYRSFHASLVPETNEEEILGIRMPKLRELGKEIAKGNVRSYLEVANSSLYEERMLRGIVTGLVKTRDYDEFAELCDSFVNEIDCWAICDCFCAGLKQVKKYRAEFFEHIMGYLNSDNKWVVRAGIVILLDYYLDDEYIDAILKKCDTINCEEYYVSMALAWLLATAFVKCEEQTMAFFKSNSLDKATFNRAIQKCVESRRVSDENKMFLKTLKKA